MSVKLFRQFTRPAESRDVGHGFSPGAATPLLPAADYKGRKNDARANVKRADAFRCVKFMTGDGKQIDVELF